MTFIAEIDLEPYQLWLVFGGLLLIMELIGAAGYLLWSGISATVVSIIIWLFPIGWALQWMLFSIITLAMLTLWWNWQKNSNTKEKSLQLNQPSSRFIGLHTVVTEPISNGLGRVKVADGSWRANCMQDLPAGANVEVVSVDGNTLNVKPIN